MMKTVVARSTFRSQNVQITSVSDHFDELVTGVGRGSRCHLVADLCQGRLPLWSRNSKVKCGKGLKPIILKYVFLYRTIFSAYG